MLRTPAAVRERCSEILKAGIADSLDHFSVDVDRLEAAARYVVDTIRQNYPDLNIPYHSRWRHFSAGGFDRAALLESELENTPLNERAKSSIDLAVTSVLLDAGAGAAWRYKESDTRGVYSRSEGLGVASFHLFMSGAFSSDRGVPLRADAAGLKAFDRNSLDQGFQVADDNPLVGIDGRVGLLNALGRALEAHPVLFGKAEPRPGNLYDYLFSRADGGVIHAGEVLAALLRGLASIWPGRIRLGDQSLGDVWRHPAVRRDDLTNGLVPFHKLSQWLAYSLFEPLEKAGLRISGANDLTGLAEYRNGGLFLDLEVIRLKDPKAVGVAHDAGSELIVEWRALTVALLDRIAPLVRGALGKDDVSMPLARILEGGTWSAGRRIAAEVREDGSPPLKIRSDGTVF